MYQINGTGATGTLNVVLLTEGLRFVTSVGEGTASSSANRPPIERNGGMCSLTSARGSRRKYGRPYETKVKTPSGEKRYAPSIVVSASASTRWSLSSGLRVRRPVISEVKTGPKRNSVPSIIWAGAI